MSRPKKQPIRPAEPEPASYRLQVFAGIDQALARLCLRDPRPKREIAEAAGINASMLSGFCSGRRIPTLEHLDRLLTTLGVGIEELTYELRTVDYHEEPTSFVPGRSRSPEPPIVPYVMSDEAMAGMLETIGRYLDKYSAQRASRKRKPKELR